MASGIVMSVPAHAPFDYIALRDLQQKGQYTDITPVPLISVPGYGSLPARDAVERAGITGQDDPRMEALTQEVYGAEFAQGRLFEKFGGRPVREARDMIAALMMDSMARSRCTSLIPARWSAGAARRSWSRFSMTSGSCRYSDPAWKAEVISHLNRMDLIPPKSVQNLSGRFPGSKTGHARGEWVWAPVFPGTRPG